MKLPKFFFRLHVEHKKTATWRMSIFHVAIDKNLV